MQRKFFTSDPHLGHSKLIDGSVSAHYGKLGRPGFSSIDEHDSILLEGINSRVGVKDILYILGDFCWGDPLPYRQRIRCKDVRFIMGNHDKRPAFEHMMKILYHGRPGHDLKDYLTCKFSNGAFVVMSHYPMCYWEKSHHGSYHLYGHCHTNREATLDILLPGRRSMDVGVDNANLLMGGFFPFLEDEIISILSSRLGHDQLSFYRGLQNV